MFKYLALLLGLVTCVSCSTNALRADDCYAVISLWGIPSSPAYAYQIGKNGQLVIIRTQARVKTEYYRKEVSQERMEVILSYLAEAKTYLVSKGGQSDALDGLNVNIHESQKNYTIKGYVIVEDDGDPLARLLIELQKMAPSEMMGRK